MRYWYMIEMKSTISFNEIEVLLISGKALLNMCLAICNKSKLKRGNLLIFALLFRKKSSVLDILLDSDQYHLVLNIKDPRYVVVLAYAHQHLF